MRRPFTSALLMNPPTGLYRRDGRCQNAVEDQTVQIVLPPMELAYAAAFLQREGVTCQVRDYPAESLGWEALEADLAAKPGAVIVQATAPTLSQDIEVCRLAKERNPEAVTIAFSPIFEERDEAILQAHPAIDIAVRGEPEMLLAQIARGEDLASLRGLCYRHGEDVIRTEYQRKEADFTQFPLPARELLRNEVYVSPDTLEPLTTIQTSRGCPYECIFCPAGAISARRVKFRTVASIMEEIEDCVRNHGVRYFLFGADTFTINKKWVMELCDAVEASGLDISWAANSRADTADLEMFQRMKATGCRIVGFGVESGDDDLLQRMKKAITTEQLRNGVALAKRAGLRTHAFFIIGLPWETRESLEKTERFALELDPDFFDFNIALPLPNTEYGQIATAESLVSETIEGRGYASSPVRSYALSQDDLSEARRRMLLKLYLRPKYIYRTLRRETRSVGQFMHLMRYGARRLRQLAAG